MKLRLLALTVSSFAVTSLLAQTPVQPAVLTPIHSLFAAMTARDGAGIRAATLPTANLLAIQDGRPTVMTLDGFVERITRPSPAHIEEKIHSPIVHTDGDLTVVWAPFDFLIDGKVDHCGTDLFNLVLVEGSWRIASITWNSTRKCPAH